MHGLRLVSLAAPILLALTAASATTSFAAAQDTPNPALSMPRIFGSHMVLQRDAKVPIFGSARPGAGVEIVGTWPGAARVRTTAGADGRFRAELATGAAGGPFELIVASGGEAHRFFDVLLGEVWLCSGQSNMEWRLRQTDGAQAAIDAGDRPTIRFFDVANVTAAAPLEDVRGQWHVSTRERSADFSAVAQYFGRELSDRLGVPIGLIESDWGGTPAQAWTSRKGLDGLAEYSAGLARLAEIAADPHGRARAQAMAFERWQRSWRRVDVGFPAPGRPLGFASVGLDDSRWDEIAVPSAWSQTALAEFDGTVWYRRQVELPRAWAGRELHVYLGPIDDDDITYLDGAEIGATRGWNTARHYRVPGRMVRGGSTTIAVRAHDTSGEGGFRGDPASIRIECPTAAGEERTISLAGVWRYHIGAWAKDLPAAPTMDRVGSWDPSALWNGMIAPIVPYAIAGAIWYQGESNVTTHAAYADLMARLIRDWRAHFGRGDFPFYFVQIAPFEYADEGNAGMLRDAQRRTLSLVPATGMAVTMDIGDPRDIHPRNKRDVGHRLARLALAGHYGRDMVPCGPLFQRVVAEGEVLWVEFSHADGLRTRDGKPSEHFEIAAEDGVWQRATAEIVGSRVRLRAAGGVAPKRARYAFGDADVPTLENAAGLPAASFVSDE